MTMVIATAVLRETLDSFNFFSCSPGEKAIVAG